MVAGPVRIPDVGHGPLYRRPVQADQRRPAEILSREAWLRPRRGAAAWPKWPGVLQRTRPPPGCQSGGCGAPVPAPSRRPHRLWRSKKSLSREGTVAPLPPMYAAFTTHDRRRASRISWLSTTSPRSSSSSAWWWMCCSPCSTSSPSFAPRRAPMHRGAAALSLDAQAATLCVPGTRSSRWQRTSRGINGLMAGSRDRLRQCHSSAAAPPQGAPCGSGQLGTPKARPGHWAPRHRLGCSS